MNRQLGKYLLRREVARGGMGVVFEAEDPELRRRVALKTVREGEVDPEYITRLRREAKIAAQLQHPNIVGIHEVGSDGTVHFIAMDFVEGQPLEALLRAKTDRAELLRILEDASRATAYAHSKGVIHRDLKPANILIEKGGRVLLVDFGLARAEAVGSRITQSSTAVGTPQYMSPEQVSGGEADARTDVYALGVILYEILAGLPPFRADSIPALFQQILYDDPKLTGEELELVALKAMDKDASRRYRDAGEFADEIGRFRRGEPVQARAPSMLYRMRKRLARKKAILLVSVLGALALGVAVLLQVRLRAEREEALHHLRKRTQNALEAALALRRAGRPEAMAPFVRETEDACRETEAKYPGLAEPRYRLGRMYRALMKNDAALAEQNAALERDADYAPALYERIVLTVRAFRARRDELIEARWGDEGHLWIRERPDADDVTLNDPAARSLRRRLEEDLQRINASEIGRGEGHCAKGLRAWVIGDRESARRDLVAAVNADATLEEAYEGLASLEADSGRYEEAIRWWTQAHERDQGYLPHLEGRGFTYALQGLSGESQVESFEASIRDMTEALRRGPDRLRTKLYRGCARLFLCAYHMLRGQEWSALHEAALADFGEVMTAAPEDPRAWVWRGLAHVAVAWSLQQANQNSEEEVKLALADFDRAIALRPDSAGAWGWRGLAKGLRRTKASILDAISDFSRSISIDAVRHTFWMWRGTAYGWLAVISIANRDRMEEYIASGIHDLDRAVELGPSYPEPWFCRGQALLTLAAFRHPRATFDIAITNLRKSTDLGKKNAAAWRALGDAYEGRSSTQADPASDCRSALEAYEEALKVNPKLESQVRAKVARCKRVVSR